MEKIFFKVPAVIGIFVWHEEYLQFYVYLFSFFENIYVEEMGDRPSKWLKLLLLLLLSSKDNLTFKWLSLSSGRIKHPLTGVFYRFVGYYMNK